jgi:hypothetical protein
MGPLPEHSGAVEIVISMVAPWLQGQQPKVLVTLQPIRDRAVVDVWY